MDVKVMNKIDGENWEERMKPLRKMRVTVENGK